PGRPLGATSRPPTPPLYPCSSPLSLLPLLILPYASLFRSHHGAGRDGALCPGSGTQYPGHGLVGGTTAVIRVGICSQGPRQRAGGTRAAAHEARDQKRSR